MKQYRNPEVRRELIIYIIITLALAALCLFINTAGSLFVLVCGGMLTLAHFWFIRKRYRRIAALCQSIDSILHGESDILISECNEGELAILYSEIQKMLIRIREQSDMLTDDKKRLTSAIEDIFHQMRTPLTSMNLAVSMLAQEDLPFERRIELTRELKRQLERTQWLVETLLKMSKIDAGTALFRKDKVHVKELIAKACEPFAIPMELREQTLDITVSDESFIGDLDWTAEALSNIIKNCMEHTPNGGTVSITARETPLFTEIVVQDSGAGFAPDDIPHLFERFYKGKGAAEQSIGIGLALCRMIIAGQNGTVAASNRIGINSVVCGAKFTVKVYKTVV